MSTGHHHDHPHPDAADHWRTHGVQVIKGSTLDPNTAQTPGMNRAAAINAARVGAQKIWAGTVTIHPDAKTGAHPFRVPDRRARGHRESSPPR